MPAASTLSKAEQFVVNKATGKTFEQAVVDATKATDVKVAEQLILKTESGVKNRIDAVSTDVSGQVRLQGAKLRLQDCLMLEGIRQSRWSKGMAISQSG